MRASLFFLLLLGLATGLGRSAPRLQAQSSPGTLYIVGGGPQTPAMVEEFVTLAGGRGQARIAVLAMASASGATSGEAKADDLRALGAMAFNLSVDHAQADLDSVAHLLDNVSAVWFGGGDQNRLMDVLRGTKLERAIQLRFANGMMVGGTSAGAAVLSTIMITGDEKRPGGARPTTDAAGANITIDRDNVVTSVGLGLLSGVIVDQHFLRRKRHNRLISLVLEHAPQLGAGIDESTALIVDGRGAWRVSGESVVVVYDSRAATAISNAPVPLGAAGLQMHILPAGSRFNPATGAISVPPNR